MPSGMELRWECFILLKRCEGPLQLKVVQGKSNQPRNVYCFSLVWDQVPQQAIQESPTAVDLTATGLIKQDGSVVNHADYLEVQMELLPQSNKPQVAEQQDCPSVAPQVSRW